MPHAAFWSGWILFAGMLMLLIGDDNLLPGLAAIFIVIALCNVAVFALAVRWDEAQADLAGTVSGR